MSSRSTSSQCYRDGQPLGVPDLSALASVLNPIVKGAVSAAIESHESELKTAIRSLAEQQDQTALELHRTRETVLKSIANMLPKKRTRRQTTDSGKQVQVYFPTYVTWKIFRIVKFVDIYKLIRPYAAFRSACQVFEWQCPDLRAPKVVLLPWKYPVPSNEAPATSSTAEVPRAPTDKDDAPPATTLTEATTIEHALE